MRKGKPKNKKSQKRTKLTSRMRAAIQAVPVAAYNVLEDAPEPERGNEPPEVILEQPGRAATSGMLSVISRGSPYKLGYLTQLRLGAQPVPPDPRSSDRGQFDQIVAAGTKRCEAAAGPPSGSI